MKQLVEQIRIMLDIPFADVTDWRDISEESIRCGDVERLTYKGLMQAIDMFAYENATYTYLTDEACTLDLAVWDKLLPQMDDIHDIISLASGIHPDILFEMLENRTTYYVDLYIRMADEYEY